jgi:hypothetical protein
MRAAHEVLFVDGVRTAFGKAGPSRRFRRTRADDLGRERGGRSGPTALSTGMSTGMGCAILWEHVG